MGLELTSAWRSPRGGKLITLTLIFLTLLLVVPLYQLSDESPGIYRHLTKYLKHEGAAYDVEEGFVANLNETVTEQVIADDAIPDERVSDVDDTKEALNNGDDAQEAHGDEEKPTQDKLLEADKPEDAQDKAQVKAGDDLDKQADGAGGSLDGDGDDKKPDTQAKKPDESNDAKIQDQESDAQGAGGSIEEDKKPEDDEAKSEGQDKASGNNDNKPEATDAHEAHTSAIDYDGSTSVIFTETRPTESVNVEVPSGPGTANAACEGFPNTDGITLVMKTGATEAYTKLPAHLLTSFQCLPDVLIFSDLDQQIGKYHLYDALKDVRDEVKKDHKEFDLYKSQVDCPIPQQYCTASMKGGWDLDKYKFLHMVEQAWAMRPNQDWYVFAEADSYIFWSNLVWYLQNKVNGTDTPYVGSVAMLKNIPFAHGGSGYVIHGETIKKMVAIPDLAHKYDLMATHECCGDYLMSLAVMETGKKVRQAHPMFNGEKPVTLPFGNGHWCEPLVTMHHMNPEEISSVWQFEKTRQKKGPIQIKEVYETFFAPSLTDKLEDWDNFSDDVCYVSVEPEAQEKADKHLRERQKKEHEKNPIEKRAHQSADNCAKVCEAARLDITDDEYLNLTTDDERNALIKKKHEERKDDKDFHGARQCFQWRHHKNVCCIAKSFKHGKPKMEEKPEDKSTSGWYVQGINDWIAAKGDCEPHWKLPS
ncbi:hypothetical protein FZEAL_5678 [Fusarium zealandicum]|uniref:Glycosyltransferase family 31 n=1 Tax=Fusarium zealandicum TaxID=1053134 RepID=A0A8H4UJC6_9HYPO|nr:hypothetical protein FZEAL_5678 [Fusarium zealandicum]